MNNRIPKIIDEVITPMVQFDDAVTNLPIAAVRSLNQVRTLPDLSGKADVYVGSPLRI